MRNNLFFFKFALDISARMWYITSCGCALSSVDRVPGYEPVGRRFESCMARHLFPNEQVYTGV